MSYETLVSVVLPTYNSNMLFLEKAIDSILTQTYKDIELILVDDFSNKQTQYDLKLLQKKYGFKLFFLNKNSGSASGPLNQGISVARGKYIAICAHDDYWLPQKLEKQIYFMELHPQYVLSYTKTFQLKEGKVYKRAQKFETGDVFDALLLQKFCIPALTVVFLKDIVKEVGFFDENLLVEDLDMWLRVAAYKEIGFLNEYLAVYRTHAGNLHSVRIKKVLADKRIVIAKWKKSSIFDKAYKLNIFYDSIHYGIAQWLSGFLNCFSFCLQRKVGFLFFWKRSLRLLIGIILVRVNAIKK